MVPLSTVSARPPPVILYTSAEAYHPFARSGMDMLVLGNHIVEKSPARPR
jgi:hypothetical protein